MELSSVRDLKAELTQSIVIPVASRAANFSYSIAVQPIRSVPFHRSLALGITRKKKNDFALAVRIQQRFLEDSSDVERIRKQAGGEVDVRYIGRVGKCALSWCRQRQRPLRIGSSVGHFGITAGTIGCFVNNVSDDDKTILLLSNNHVLANENRGKKGDAIVQPGVADKGLNPTDAVGTLDRFVRLQKASSNRVDAAVAVLADGIDHSPVISGIGKISGVGDADLSEGKSVSKIGRTTGLTSGKITAFEVDDIVVGYDIGDLQFGNLIEIEGAADLPFAQGGDSGSLVVSEKKEAVGLVFATSDQGGSNGKGVTYANPLSLVLDKMQIRLIY
jgi:hypothetical protein